MKYFCNPFNIFLAKCFELKKKQNKCLTHEVKVLSLPLAGKNASSEAHFSKPSVNVADRPVRNERGHPNLSEKDF